ncbi:hypothetical protein B0H11DRAFT_2058193, partial [Mycena galericulata]
MGHRMFGHAATTRWCLRISVGTWLLISVSRTSSSTAPRAVHALERPAQQARDPGDGGVEVREYAALAGNRLEEAALNGSVRGTFMPETTVRIMIFLLATQIYSRTANSKW